MGVPKKIQRGAQHLSGTLLIHSVTPALDPLQTAAWHRSHQLLSVGRLAPYRRAIRARRVRDRDLPDRRRRERLPVELVHHLTHGPHERPGTASAPSIRRCRASVTRADRRRPAAARLDDPRGARASRQRARIGERARPSRACETHPEPSRIERARACSRDRRRASSNAMRPPIDCATIMGCSRLRIDQLAHDASASAFERVASLVRPACRKARGPADRGRCTRCPAAASGCEPCRHR